MSWLRSVRAVAVGVDLCRVDGADVIAARGVGVARQRSAGARARRRARRRRRRRHRHRRRACTVADDGSVGDAGAVADALANNSNDDDDDDDDNELCSNVSFVASSASLPTMAPARSVRLIRLNPLNQAYTHTHTHTRTRSARSH